jgi:hypothetical protein
VSFGNPKIAEPESRELRQEQRYPLSLHFVLIRVVVPGIQSLMSDAAAKRLHCYGAIRADQLEMRFDRGHSWASISGGSYQHISPKPSEIGNHHTGAISRDRVPKHQLRCCSTRVGPSHIGVVTHQIVETRAGNLAGQRATVLQAELNPPGHLVAGSAGNRVVKLTPHEHTPGMAKGGAPV